MILSNTNGLAANIYYLLWIKDQGLLETKGCDVRIPNTVIFKGPAVMFWYFTGSNGQVLKKKSNMLTPQCIFESFTEDKPQSRSGIVAQLMSDNREMPVLNHSRKRQSEAPQGEEKVMIRYLDAEALKDYLFNELNNEKVNREIVLQQFIDPPGESNSVIEAVWSPFTCLFTRRINNLSLSATSYETYERAVTFDGPEIFSKPVCLKGQAISGEIRGLCEKIVTRVSRVTYEKLVITRMTLFFKTDSLNRLHFLYCTSIRLAGERTEVAQKGSAVFIKRIDNNSKFQTRSHPTSANSQKSLESSQALIYSYERLVSNTPLAIDSNYEQPPNMRNTYSLVGNPAKLTNDFCCPICENMCQKDDTTQLPLMYLLGQESSIGQQCETLKSRSLSLFNSPAVDQRIQQEGIEEKKKKDKIIEVVPTPNQVMQHLAERGSHVPMPKKFVEPNAIHSHPLIRKLYPKMTPEIFLHLQSSTFFKSTQIRLCHKCFLASTDEKPKINGQNNSNLTVKIEKHLTQSNPTLFTNKINKILLAKNLEFANALNDHDAEGNASNFKRRLSLIAMEENSTLPKRQVNFQQSLKKPSTAKIQGDSSVKERNLPHYQLLSEYLNKASSKQYTNLVIPKVLISPTSGTSLSIRESGSSLTFKERQFSPKAQSRSVLHSPVSTNRNMNITTDTVHHVGLKNNSNKMNNNYTQSDNSILSPVSISVRDRKQAISSQKIKLEKQQSPQSYLMSQPMLETNSAGISKTISSRLLPISENNLAYSHYYASPSMTQPRKQIVVHKDQGRPKRSEQDSTPKNHSTPKAIFSKEQNIQQTSSPIQYFMPSSKQNCQPQKAKSISKHSFYSQVQPPSTAPQSPRKQPSLISPNRSYLSFSRPVSKNSGRISSKSSHTQNLPISTNSIPTKPKVNELFDSQTELEQLACDYEKEQGS